VADVQIFADLFTNIDEAVLKIFTDAAKGVSAYITPIAWVALGIMLLITAAFIAYGRGNDTMAFAKKLFYGCLIISALGGLYVPWIAMPLLKIPDELSLAVTNRSAATDTVDALAGHLLDLVVGVLQAVVETFKTWNVGGALVLLIAAVMIIVAGSLLLVAVVFNIVYAKIGMAYLLGVGPLFIFFLMIPAVKSWFNSWLNTVFYFVMLTVFSTMTMLMFTGIANKFMEKLAAAIQSAFSAKLTFAKGVYSWLAGSMSTAATGDAALSVVTTEWSIISIALQIVLVFIPLFLVAMETRTMVQSVTGGSGGSFGTGVVNAVSTAWRGGLGRPG
jgi:type IV secretion system protein VirB6